MPRKLPSVYAKDNVLHLTHYYLSNKSSDFSEHFLQNPLNLHLFVPKKHPRSLVNKSVENVLYIFSNNIPFIPLTHTTHTHHQERAR